MSDVYFVDLDLRLRVPRRNIVIPGKVQAKVLKHLACSFPIHDLDKATELMDGLAKGIADLFQQVQADDQRQHQAAQADRSGPAGEQVRRGDQGPNAYLAALPEPSRGSEGNPDVGSDLPKGA